MTGVEQVVVLTAGIAAGAINAVVGSGTLITFPVLVAVGFSPVVANVANTIGLVPGLASGAYGYRRELRGQRRRLLPLGAGAVLGGLTGGMLLLVLPAPVFRTAVPVLIGLACVLVLVQPEIQRRLARRGGDASAGRGPLMVGGVFATAVYGGYFGAAQGVLLLAILGLGLPDDLQRLNGAKNVLAGLVNLVAAGLFVAVADVAWEPVLLVAAGSTVGGQIGASVGRRLPPTALRGAIVMVGTTAAARLLWS